MSLVLLALAGGAGALARAWLTEAWGARGTLWVNLLGAFALGVVVALPQLGEIVERSLAIGFLGAFTTFSGWMLEAAERWRDGSCAPGPLGRVMCRRVLMEVALILLVGVLAFWAGIALGALFR